MTIDQIDRMVRHANPVPDPSVLGAVDAADLLIEEQRRTDMQTQDRVEVDKEPRSPRTGLLVGVAAAAIVVIGALVLVQTDNTDDVATDPEASVSLATEFMEARIAMDVERMLTYFADDASIGGGPATSIEELPREIAWQRAVGLRFTFNECVAEPSNPSTVRCTVDYETDLGDDTGVFTYMVTAENDQIDRAFLSSLGNFWSNAWNPFRLWVRDNHPDDFSAMFGENQGWGPLTEESVNLWESHSARYFVEQSPRVREAVANAEGYVVARAERDLATALSFLADDAVLDWGPGTSPGTLDEGLAWERAFGVNFELIDCRVGDVVFEAIPVTCAVTQDSVVSAAAGTTAEPACVDFRIDDGLITEAILGCGNFVESTLEPFQTWLSEAHPDTTFDSLYNDGTSPEGLALWEQYTAEFVAEHTG